MKVKHQSLKKFIADYSLENAEGIICFKAEVVLMSLHQNIQVRTEVQIITLTATGLDVIYLLAPDVIKHNLPETISTDAAIEYHENKFLYVKGSSLEHGHHILSIHPFGLKGSKETLQELFQKTYN